MGGERVAAVHCGSNSVRLLVTDGSVVIERHRTVTRLATEPTLACLRDYRSIMDRHGVSRCRAGMTRALDRTHDPETFLDGACEALGAKIELLPAGVETELAFRGAAAELDPDAGPYLVAGIGRNSTGFAHGSSHCEGVLVADLGSGSLSEQYIEHDPPLPEELLACLSVTAAHLDDLAREVPAVGSHCRLVGLSGTVATAAAVELGLGSYDRDQIHHFRLGKAAVEDVFRTLATEARRDRIHNPGLAPSQVDVIVAGLCILVGIMRYFDFDHCLVSESDLLEGSALSLLDP